MRRIMYEKPACHQFAAENMAEQSVNDKTGEKSTGGMALESKGMSRIGG